MPLWVSDLAEQFWTAAGEAETFPRNLRRPIAFALPLSVVSLPRLRLATVDDWLARQGIPRALESRDRWLRACLVARFGQGLIFVDGIDPANEQAFSLAHELAHFLRHYWYRRETAAKRLGPSILAAVDGIRKPSPDEQIRSLLAHVPLDFHTHLMERTVDGRFASREIDSAERDADLLAFELLAPSDAVLSQVPPSAPGDRTDVIRRCLLGAFGLADEDASRYAALLSPEPQEPNPLLRRLGLAPLNVELFEMDGK